MVQLKDDEIDARPTKEFFINSLTKDIYLIDLIPDLVDNCLDGILRIRNLSYFLCKPSILVHFINFTMIITYR